MTRQDDRFIDRAALEGRLEPFLLRRLDPGRQRFRLRSFQPVLSANRLDLATKLAFLQSRGLAPASFPARLYDAHVAAFSLGSMSEPGSPEKQGAKGFRSAFLALLDSMSRGGFDPQRSLIPLAADGSILNGAHRAACALHLGLPLTGIETELEPVRYDGAYFRARGMSEADLDAMALAHVERATDTAIAVLFPGAPLRGDRAAALPGRTVYARRLHLSPRGAQNLLTEITHGAPIWGHRKPVRARLLVLDLPATPDCTALRAELRTQCSGAPVAVHVTETHGEAVRLARLLLNRQGRHFLDHASPPHLAELAETVSGFRAALTGQGANPDRTVLGAEMVLGAFGLRAPQTVGYLSCEPVALPAPYQRVETADDSPGVAEILSDPALHFRFRNQHFLSLPLVTEGLRRSGSAQDGDTLIKMAELLQPLRESGWSYRLARLRLAHARARHAGIRLLEFLRLKEAARRLYRRARPHR